MLVALPAIGDLAKLVPGDVFPPTEADSVAGCNPPARPD